MYTFSQLEYYSLFHLEKPLTLIMIIIILVTIIGGLFASIAKAIPDIEATQYRIKPDLFLLPSKNIAEITQTAVR